MPTKQQSPLLFSTGNIRSFLPNMLASPPIRQSHQQCKTTNPLSEDERLDLKVTIHLYVPLANNTPDQLASIVQRACMYARKEIAVSSSDMSVLHFSLNSVHSSTNSTAPNQDYIQDFLSMWKSLEHCYAQRHTFALGLSLESSLKSNDENSLLFLKLVWDSMVVKPHQIFIPKTYPYIEALRSFINAVNHRDQLNIRISISSSTQDLTTPQHVLFKNRNGSDSTTSSLSSPPLETQFMARYDVISNVTNVIVNSGYVIETQVKA